MKKFKLFLTILLGISVVFFSCKDPEPAHEHEFSDSWSKDGTYHWHAATCEHTTEVRGKAKHSFGDWTVTKEATEEAEGTKERSCTVCGYTATEAIEKLAHTHKFATDWTKDATHHWHASTCGHEVTEGKAAHSFGNWTITKAATEEAEGSKERSCTVCGYTATEVIEKLAHTHKFATDWTKDETHYWYAATCGHTTEVSEKAEHTFGNWITTKAATEEAEGSKERSCSICGYTATEAIEKLAHTHKFATDWTKDETHHWKAATCEHTTEVSDKAAHSFGNWTTTKAATEEAEGTKERSCTVCGYTATEAIEKLAHTHKFATDWTKDVTHHWKAATCEHATEVSAKAEHTFGEYVSNNDATTEADGTKTRECSVCGYEDTVTDEGSKIIVPEGFVLIPAGTFQMGSNTGDDDEKPVHEVTITKDFYMGKYEVTQAEYEKYCSYGGSKPSSSYGDGDNYPAYRVSWYDALVYCNKRSIAEGLTPCYSISGNADPSKWGTVPTSTDSTWDAVVCDWNANGYRLPTEAEWEYAARAGDNTVDSLTYSGTSDVNKLGEYAWYAETVNGNTHPVGTKKANAFGLYDMSGNVWEWCWNWNTISYNTDLEGGSDPTGPSWGVRRVNRGGCWGNDSGLCAVSYRYFSYPDVRGHLGFRVVRAATGVIENLAHTHKFAEEWTKDETNHWHASTCGHDVTDSKATHTFGEWQVTKEASCIEKGERKATCTVCDFEKTEVSGKHSFGDWTVTKTATKEAEGSKERVCTVCNYKEVVDIAKIPEDFVLIPAGTFQMGSEVGRDSNKPVHEVTITKPFYMGKYEVTQAEIQKYLEVDVRYYEKGYGGNYPAYYVSWYDALVYCNKRSIAEGLTPCYSIDGSTDPKDWGTIPSEENDTWDAVVCDWDANGYRLPTEAEWEYAARAGDNTISPLTWSGTSDFNIFGKYAWYQSNSNSATHMVGIKLPNAYGLYDMSGNIDELCWNRYTDSYDTGKEGGSDPTGSSVGYDRVRRGGSWFDDFDVCAVSCRSRTGTTARFLTIGFRVVRSAVVE